jgi:glycosyltransferase involved in cell wall biosynthesis
MRILFLTETLPFPLDSGGRIKTFHTLRILSQEHEVHCHAFIRDEAQRSYDRELQACCQTLTLHLKHRSILDEAKSWLVGYASGTPFLVRRHFDRSVFAHLKAVLEERDFDAVYCDHLSMIEYGRRLGLPMIHDAHNVEYEIVRRHAATGRLSIWRGFAELEWRMLRRYERKHYPRCELIYSVSDIDAQAIRECCAGQNAVAVVPISVDVDGIAQVSPTRAGPELLFVGGLHWPPNADAVRYFIEEILPTVRTHIPAVHLTIVGRTDVPGRRPPQPVDGVTFAGHVPDIEPYFHRSRAMVVPLRSGSGMRVKILDSLARGMPTVTTSIGCEGIEATAGQHLLVADTAEAFAASVIRLLTDDTLATRLSRCGRDLVHCHYSEAVVGRQTLAVLNRHRRLFTSARLSSQA